ncbi:PRC-barrel domain-containing protein [Sediminibacillus massiliensis]|uniref:PRC-barrel domain-containing protein n=1 Tax=Sediminibacillus massiliensis TaxID=1926277 RepID=UPI00098843F0|nr:PRC-barrel domain-containing protein [Sediminibacillus massiliensis]
MIILYYGTNLESYRLQASDGELGKVQELYFDDNKWVVRYLGVDTRKWLPGRTVLLSPSSFKKVDRDNGHVEVTSDKETVRNSPSLEENSSMTPDYELALTRYYGWTPYWSGGFLWGTQDNPFVETPDAPVETEPVPRMEETADEVKHQLRAVTDLTEGFTIHANDGKIGSINDVLIDGDNWKIRYLVAESAQEFPENYYLFSPDWVESIDWTEGNVYVDIRREEVRQGPGLKEKQEVTRAQENEIYSAFGKSEYWF